MNKVAQAMSDGRNYVELTQRGHVTVFRGVSYRNKRVVEAQSPLKR